MKNVTLTNVKIKRGHPGHPGCTVLEDSSGAFLQRFPVEVTDVQILASLRFALSAYKEGVSEGRRERNREVAKALGILA